MTIKVKLTDGSIETFHGVAHYRLSLLQLNMRLIDSPSRLSYPWTINVEDIRTMDITDA